MGAYSRYLSVFLMGLVAWAVMGCDKIPFLNRGGEEAVVEVVEDEGAMKPVGVVISGLSTDEEVTGLKDHIHITGLMKQGSSQYARVNDELVKEGDTFVLKMGETNYLMTVVAISITKHNVRFEARAE